MSDLLFNTIALGSAFSFLGMFVLWLTTMIPQAKPGPCNQHDHPCKSTSTSQYLLLLSAFVIISIGAGGTRPCSLPFGADQIDKKDNPMNERTLERFFGWYYAAAAVGVILAFTGIVYIQDHFGWKLGFGIPAILMFLSTFFFLLASSLYIKPKVKTNLFSSFVQVIVLSYKKRKLTFPWQDSLDIPEEIGPDGVASNPSNICTVDQVEELKTLIRVMPLWSTAIMISVNISQSSFGLLQANSMDRRLIGELEIPAGSFTMFTIGTICTWIMLYDRVLIPLASKIRGKPVYLGTKVRMGIGLFCSFLSMVVSAIVEHIRRRKAFQQGLSNNSSGLVNMSAYWLVPQHVLGGFAEAFNSIAQTEFYYSEFPKSMSSIASAMLGLGMAFANLLASAILNTVNHVTSIGRKVSWTSTNINEGHYESYYWLLAIMSAVNLLYFLVCSWGYGPCLEQRNEIRLKNKRGCGSSEEELWQSNEIGLKN
ncbi:Major facilitator superfamily domain, general substrate transporter [Heracleum sosnowskyi]|uniref:Major facilitator superfamily domain, general substrate transporter n=1 Tax=Heracleum sosnowskyi TaxID=360622 RepID=A0AAD8H252_9APIA|nr:Major facilitator superfamily domain, general substrate transporter [Heracleum sosnowskyi]